MAKLVCDVSERNCMLHRREKCPGSDSLREHLQSVFSERSIEEDHELTFKQWTHIQMEHDLARQELACVLLEEIVLQINALTSHSFIAKAQAAYPSQQKESLTRGTAVVSLDFAENYSFVVQDAVQGYYWDNSQATLHPLVAYYRKEDGNLGTISFCVVSDCLKHDATAVYAFISVIITHLKKLIPGLSLVRYTYFSDGAASQYKNCKNFLNLCYHEEDFGVKAEWHFFATSHGKSPCDGIGGTIKRLVASAIAFKLPQGITFSMLKNSFRGQKLTFRESKCVSTEEIEKCEMVLEPRTSGRRQNHSRNKESTQFCSSQF